MGEKMSRAPAACRRAPRDAGEHANTRDVLLGLVIKREGERVNNLARK